MARTRSLILIIFLFAGRNAALPQGESWYKGFVGSIDKYPVTLHLHKAGHTYAGYYYYHSREEPVYFLGDDTTKGDGKIRLSVFHPNSQDEESFVLSVSGTAINGNWMSGPNKVLSFAANEKPMPVAFDYIYSEGRTVLRPNLTGSPEASFEAASVWPKQNGAKVIFLKKLIREQFGEKTSAEEIGAIFLRQKKQFATDYVNDNKEMKDEDLKDAFSYNLDQTDRLMVVYQSPRILVLALLTYAYTGGAHGNYGTAYVPIDASAQKVLKLNDVITATGKTKLSKLLEKSFRKAYSLKETDSLSEGGLFENEIEPNDNFYITSKGIGFCYNPYEIGPYAMGEIHIFIPFTELASFLKPEFRKVIQ